MALTRPAIINCPLNLAWDCPKEDQGPPCNFHLSAFPLYVNMGCSCRSKKTIMTWVKCWVIYGQLWNCFLHHLFQIIYGSYNIFKKTKTLQIYLGVRNFTLAWIFCRVIQIWHDFEAFEKFNQSLKGRFELRKGAKISNFFTVFSSFFIQLKEL